MIKLEKDGQIFEVETSNQASAFIRAGFTEVIETEKKKTTVKKEVKGE